MDEITLTPLKWFHFDQNNSGGDFLVTDKMAHDVFIQATTAAEAIKRAEEIGLDPYERYCGCCGERWSWSYLKDSDGTSEPMKYGEPYTQMERGMFRDEGRYHYIDGHIEAVVQGCQQPARIA